MGRKHGVTGEDSQTLEGPWQSVSSASERSEPEELMEEAWSSEWVTRRVLWGFGRLSWEARGGGAGSLMGVTGPPSWGSLLLGRERGGPWATTKEHL